MKKIKVTYCPEGEIKNINNIFFRAFSLIIAGYNLGISGEISFYRVISPESASIDDFISSNGNGYNVFIDSDESDGLLLDIYVNKPTLFDMDGNPVENSEIMDLVYSMDENKFKTNLALSLFHGENFEQIWIIGDGRPRISK